MYLSEEIGFYNGVGVSLGLMRRAVAMDLDRGRYVYGGSTIMQQLVKNLYLSRAKTLSRKLEEAVIVWAMLTRVSKDRILEMYLNCIEFGPNIYGIRAASEYYFDKPPQWLTPLEAVYLANLKPSPRDGANHHRRGHSPVRGWWQERTRTILERLVEYTGSITPEEVEYYSPYILPLMGSPAWQASGYEPMERPEWAVLGLPPPGHEQVDDGSSTTAP
jgi:membrane peptidoglycan carboxypeptidase